MIVLPIPQPLSDPPHPLLTQLHVLSLYQKQTNKQTMKKAPQMKIKTNEQKAQ